MLSPHPPIVIPDVGGEEATTAQSTTHALETACKWLVEQNPETIVICGPHGPLFSDAFTVLSGREASGDLRQFGAEREFHVSLDEELARKLMESLRFVEPKLAWLTPELYRRYGLPDRLDHGVLVPLYFLQQAGWDGPVMILNPSGYSLPEHYQLGAAVQQAARDLNRRIALVVSGDLSHRQSEDGPYGYHPDGPKFDKIIVDVLESADPIKLWRIPAAVRENAGPCADSPLSIGLGALDGLAVRPWVLSHEAPFGVGYGVAIMAVEGESSSRRFLDRLSEVNEKKDESPAVRLARATVEAYTRDEPLPDPADFSGLPEGEAGVFVSIHKFDALRGCIGTTAPTTASIGHEIVNNAIQACSSDPRFDQVTERELPYLTISVDVLNPAEPIADKSQLDPKKYGVIVRRGRRSGLLLPDLPGVDTVENQLSIARQKAGLDDDRGVEMYRFTVTRYE